MRSWLLPVAATLLGTSGADAASVGALRDHRRVLIVAAPTSADAGLAAQRHILASWTGGAADRDVSTVEVVGDSVSGADEGAVALRTRYALPRRRFALVLIGKDGHVAYRSDRPATAATLEATIDAMPMRRAGQR